MEHDASSIAAQVVEAFGGLTATARALRHRHVTTVHGWVKSGRIPQWRRGEITEAARVLGVKLPPAFLDEMSQAA